MKKYFWLLLVVLGVTFALTMLINNVTTVNAAVGYSPTSGVPATTAPTPPTSTPTAPSTPPTTTPTTPPTATPTSTPTATPTTPPPTVAPPVVDTEDEYVTVTSYQTIKNQIKFENDYVYDNYYQISNVIKNGGYTTNYSATTNNYYTTKNSNVTTTRYNDIYSTRTYYNNVTNRLSDIVDLHRVVVGLNKNAGGNLLDKVICRANDSWILGNVGNVTQDQLNYLRSIQTTSAYTNYWVDIDGRIVYSAQYSKNQWGWSSVNHHGFENDARALGFNGGIREDRSTNTWSSGSYNTYSSYSGGASTSYANGGSSYNTSYSTSTNATTNYSYSNSYSTSFITPPLPGSWNQYQDVGTVVNQYTTRVKKSEAEKAQKELDNQYQDVTNVRTQQVTHTVQKTQVNTTVQNTVANVKATVNKTTTVNQVNSVVANVNRTQVVNKTINSVTNVQNKITRYQIVAVYCESPIILDLDNSKKVDVSAGIWLPHTPKLFKDSLRHFDITGDSKIDLTEWILPNPSDALLVMPENGKVTNALQLFGTAGGYLNGYEKLALVCDKDNNGWVEGEELEGLKLWIDHNNDAVCQISEMEELSAYGVTKISAWHENYVGQFQTKDGKLNTTWDWWPTVAEVRKFRN